MDFEKSVIDSLGLSHVKIESMQFDKKKLRATFVVRQNLAKSFCPCCGVILKGVHDWFLKTLRAPPWGIFREVTVEFYYPRAFCAHCNKQRIPFIPWIHPKHRSVTCSFAEIAGRLMEETTCEATGRLLKFDSMILWRIDQFRMNFMFERLNLAHANCTYLSTDEVHFRSYDILKRTKAWSKRKDIIFVTNLVSYKDGKVLSNAVGRDSKALHKCLNPLSESQKKSVEHFSVDIHKPFIATVKKELPKALISIDRFHLVQKLNDAFNKVRRAEFKNAKKKGDKFGQKMLVPHRRFILISRSKKMTKYEIKLLSKLRELNRNIHNGMLIVEYLHKLLDYASVEKFRGSLQYWYLLVREAKLKPFLKLAKLIRTYRELIENYIVSGLTTAVSEGLNNKIKTLKRMAYGYANSESFRLKILQRCGYLNHRYIQTNDLLFQVPNPTI